MNSGSNMRFFHIALVVWILGFASIGFAENFPNRPTAAELDGLVVAGTQCARGVNERCWATQYQTNPAQYHVSPLTNNACWYLDSDLMGTMASKIKSLVTNYVDPDTVCDGMTNIVTLTVTGLWAQLEIGDKASQFTCTPANGTNAATYGDYPDKVYIEDLQERCDVMHALTMTDAGYSSYGTNNQVRYAVGTVNGHSQAGYNDLAAIFNSTSWSNGVNYWSGTYGIAAYMDNDGYDPCSMMRNKGQIVLGGLYSTNLTANSYKLFLHITQLFDYFYDDGYGTNANYHFVSTLPGSTTFPYTTAYFGDIEGALQLHSLSPEDNWCTGWKVGGSLLITDWKFDYCTDE